MQLIGWEVLSVSLAQIGVTAVVMGCSTMWIPSFLRPLWRWRENSRINCPSAGLRLIINYICIFPNLTSSNPCCAPSVLISANLWSLIVFLIVFQVHFDRPLNPSPKVGKTHHPKISKAQRLLYTVLLLLLSQSLFHYSLNWHNSWFRLDANSNAQKYTGTRSYPENFAVCLSITNSSCFHVLMC